MKMLIEVVTSYNTYTCFKWDKETEEHSHESTKEQIQRIIDADEDDVEEIAREFIMDWGADHMIPEAWFHSIEVHYPDGEHPNESISVDQEVENNNDKSITELYEKEIDDIDANRVVILKDEQWKRGLWEVQVETDKPFNINFFSVMDGEITYGMHTLENVDGGEGNYSDIWVYRS